MKKLIMIILSSFIIYSCIAGGDLIEHKPPKVKVGERVKFELTLKAPGGNAEKGFQKATLYYMIEQSNKYTKTQMDRIYADIEKVVFKLELKALSEEYKGKTFHYYFSYLGDGEIYYYYAPNDPLSVVIE